MVCDVKRFLAASVSLKVHLKRLDPNDRQGTSSVARVAIDSEWQKVEAMQTIPETLRDALFPFQREGVEYVVGHNGRALIGDEMGLGKTIQAIAVASFYRDEWPVLVICPSSVRLSWRDEFLRWLPGDVLRAHHVEVVVNGKAVLTSSSSRWGRESVGRKGKSPTGKKVIIVSYDLVPKLLDQIQQVLNKLVFLLPFHNVGCVV